MVIKLFGLEFSTYGGLFIKVPFIGQAHYSRALGWTGDRWATLKATGEAHR